MPGSVTFYGDDPDDPAPIAVQLIPDRQAAVMADIPPRAARAVIVSQEPPDPGGRARIAELEDRLAAARAALPDDDGSWQPYDRWSDEAVALVRVYEALDGERPWWAKDDTVR